MAEQSPLLSIEDIGSSYPIVSVLHERFLYRILNFLHGNTELILQSLLHLSQKKMEFLLLYCNSLREKGLFHGFFNLLSSVILFSESPLNDCFHLNRFLYLMYTRFCNPFFTLAYNFLVMCVWAVFLALFFRPLPITLKILILLQHTEQFF